MPTDVFPRTAEELRAIDDEYIRTNGLAAFLVSHVGSMDDRLGLDEDEMSQVAYIASVESPDKGKQWEEAIMQTKLDEINLND